MFQHDRLNNELTFWQKIKLIIDRNDLRNKQKNFEEIKI